MAANFWKEAGRDIFVLAPMEDVTDTVFREVILSISSSHQLHVMYTEFCSTDGLCHPVGKKKVIHRLQVNLAERSLLKEKNVKLVVQIWGSDPEKFRTAVRMINNEFEFDGIDINMGCPVKKIVKQGGCSALIGSPGLAKEIIQATRESTHLPVSVKTRTGLKQHTTVAWLGHIFSCSPDAVILHCRTQKDMSENPADWNQMNIAVDLRNLIAPGLPLIGNGDIFTMEDARVFLNRTKADGVMFGRGIFRNPWLFNREVTERTMNERLQTLWKHAALFEDTWGHTKNFSVLKRFFKIYTSGIENVSDLRSELMRTNSTEEVRGLLKGYIPV